LVTPAAVARQLAERDPVLGRIIAAVGEPAIERPSIASPAHYLQRAIVGQQLSGKAASTIYGRFLGVYRGRRPSAAQVLDTPERALRAAGLSAGKARAIRDLAAHQRDGAIPSREALYRLDVETIVERLTAVRGIGRWTVEMLLIFYLGHCDVLPLGDLGIKKGYQRVYRMRQPPSPRTLERRGRRWQPYRSVASWYLWRALELPPD
jgi:DNA-3-methyladenine glycosylase II